MKDLLRRLIGILCSLVFCFAFSSSFLFSSAIVASASTVYGDVDSDGYVTVGDVVFLLRYLKGDVQTGEVNLKYADVDKNTVLDSNDSKTILRYLSHYISSLPYSTGTMFNYDSYTVPTDSARWYVKYDCSSGNTTNYSLSLPIPSNSPRSGNYDDRVPDSSANAQCIVRLRYKDGNGDWYRGSGFIVDDHVIATCGHCLYDTDNDVFSTNFTIKVYDIAGTSVVETYSANELHVPLLYSNNHNPNYDYGLIYVEEDLLDYGQMALGLPTDIFEYTGQTVYASGFPGYIHIGQPNEAPENGRFYGAGVITTFTDSMNIYYTAYTSGGDSGGPVFMEYTLGNDTFRSAIGIMTNSTGSIHWGARMTLPLLRFFLDNPNIG